MTGHDDDHLPTTANVLESLQLPFLIGGAFTGEELEWPREQEDWVRGYGTTEYGVRFGFAVSVTTPTVIRDRDEVQPPASPQDAAAEALRSLRAWVADHAGETIDRAALKREIDRRIATTHP